MLYVTTRNTKDVFTVNHAILKDRCADGGLYVPYQVPVMTREEVIGLKEKSFSQCIAELLNLFLGVKLSGYDIELNIGRYPVKMVSMSHKIAICELWHNPESDFTALENAAAKQINADVSSGIAPSDWVRTAVRISVLFGVFSELLRSDSFDITNKLDISVSAGDFQMPVAAWYARQMGLPIGMIICGCNQNGMIWDLIHHGQIKTDTVAVRTRTPKCDYSVAPGLERLIFSTLGEDEANRFAAICQRGGLYALKEDKADTLATGLYSAVVSDQRMMNVINSVYRTNEYLLDPYSALAFSALQDYRTVAGETRPALIISEASAVCSADTVAESLGISKQELLDRIYAK